ncbi:MAG TPA: hypothetical protein VF777_14455 [Phycisphaerales bacterium]
MAHFDERILNEIDELGKQTGALADRLGTLIRNAEQHLQRLPGKVEAQYVHWFDNKKTPPIRIRFRRNPRSASASWGFFVEQASSVNYIAKVAQFDVAETSLVEANLPLKVLAVEAIPGIFAAVRDAQRSMSERLLPAVKSLESMVYALETKGGV